MSEKTALFKSQYKNFTEMCEQSEGLDQWDTSKYGLTEEYVLEDLFALALHFIAVDGEIADGEVSAFNECLGYEYGTEELTDIYENCREIIDYGVEERLKEDLMSLEQLDSHLAAAFEGMVFTLLEILSESDGYFGISEQEEILRLKAAL